MLEVNNISKMYRGIPAIRNVSFRVGAGEILGYLGPNGAGKSTTVKIVTGLVAPTSGNVLFAGSPISEDLVQYRSNLGYIPEEAHLYTHLSGLEYLTLVGRLRKLPEELIKDRAEVLLGKLGLESSRYTPIGLYSKGMRQRVLIAAALLHGPRLLVFDEPLSGLDAASARLFRDLLIELAADGKAILYISHVLEVVEKVCNNVLILANGDVKAMGPPGELTKRWNLPDLAALYASLTAQADSRATARSLVEAVYAK